MPTREAERRPEQEEAVEPAPPAVEAPATKFSDEGEIPAVSAKTAEPAATASERAFDKKPPPGEAPELDSGLHEPEEYREACEKAGRPEKWKPEYANGHTSAKQFSQPSDRAPFSFSLGRGQSASQAIKDFLAGPTIADYRAIAVALELDELRDDLTDNRFDQLFGSRDSADDSAIPGDMRLHISSAMYTTPFVAKMMDYVDKRDAGARDDDPLPPPAAELREDAPKQEAEAEEEEAAAIVDDLAKDPVREVV
ncbi:MAG TPA: hypothetical protein VMJ10_35350 [Kofleriaceae bacterium]|nr:hypothetical protein [Kofleriaceae bacterium]